MKAKGQWIWRGLFVLGFAAWTSMVTAIEENMVGAVAGLREDIARDTAALVALREQIAEAREPLAVQLESLQQEAMALRAEMERVQRLRQQGEQDQARLRERAAAANESVQFAQNLLTEYARSVETRVTSADAVAWGGDLLDLRERLPEVEPAELSALARQLLNMSYAWNVKRFGGHVLSGTALDADGIAQEGQFAVLGPLSFFVASDMDLAGIAISRMGRLEPGLYVLGSADRVALRSLLAGQVAHIPIDLTGGDAFRLEESRGHYIERLQQGGFVMIPLLLTGGFAFVLAVWKFVALLRLHRAIKVDIGPIARSLHQGDIEQAQDLMAEVRAPLADVLQEAIIHRGAPREHLEEILHEHVVNVLPQAERHLGMLAVLGGVAPLLGLLGTVTGMIHTFQLVTLFGSGDARMLSGGISEALVTTETGLIIAVPVLLVQAGLARWARSIVAALERKSIVIVNHLHARGSGS